MMNDKPEPLSTVAVDPLVMRRLLIHVYNCGYTAGHEATVEGNYTDIFQCDMGSYHNDAVDALVGELKALRDLMVAMELDNAERPIL